MFWVIHVILFALLLIAAYQDFKWRGIHWVLIPLLAGVFLFFSVQEATILEVLKSAFINVCFVLIQFLLISIWFSIKSGKVVNVLKQHIGIGDLLFFVCLCFAFSPVNFILFMITALILSLLIHLIVLLIVKNADRTVPLAGLVAMMLNIVLVFESVFYPGLLQNDEIITNLLGLYYV